MKFRFIVLPCEYNDRSEPLRWLAVSPDYCTSSQGATKEIACDRFIKKFRTEFLHYIDQGLTDEEVLKEFGCFNCEDLELKVFNVS